MLLNNMCCLLRWDKGQPYGLWRALVTHMIVNTEYSRSESSQNSVSYAKFVKLLQEQGYFKEAETLANEVLDTRNRIVGVEHPDTVRDMVKLAATYYCPGKYREVEKLNIQILDARNIILGVEHDVWESEV